MRLKIRKNLRTAGLYSKFIGDYKKKWAHLKKIFVFVIHNTEVFAQY